MHGTIGEKEKVSSRKKCWKKALQVSILKKGERELERFRLVLTYPQKFFFICSLWSISEVGLSVVFPSLLHSRHKTYLITKGEAWVCFKNFKLVFHELFGISLYLLISSSL